MDEKIKLTLPQATLDVLKKDCEDLLFEKPDGSPNFNAFLNTLVERFCDRFTARELALYEDVRAALGSLPARAADTAFAAVLAAVNKRSEAGEGQRTSVTLSFKPTKVSERARMTIAQTIAPSEAFSSFYRRLFAAYAQNPKNEREKIICADVLAELHRAIDKGVCVCLTLRTGDVLRNASVHSVCASREELFNYALVRCNGKNTTVRVAAIRAVTLLSRRADLPQEARALFDRQAAIAPQYTMYNTDSEPIRVQLTEKGKKLFRKIYLYRPTPIAVDGDVYTFDCSANQLLYYFERFGDTALILSPKRLGIFMRNYHYYAYRLYAQRYPHERDR